VEEATASPTHIDFEPIDAHTAREIPWWRQKTTTTLAWTAEEAQNDVSETPERSETRKGAEQGVQDKAHVQGEQTKQRVKFVIDALGALKENQDAKLLRVLRQEQMVEQERGQLRSRAGTPEDRYRLDKILAIERLKAGKRVAAITESQEREFLATRERLEMENGILVFDYLVQKRSVARGTRARDKGHQAPNGQDR
jgi:hypothetical protein